MYASQPPSRIRSSSPFIAKAPFGDFQARDLGQLDVHQNEIRPVITRKRQGLQPLTGLQGLIALGVEQIMKQLHVQLVILDDEDFFGHIAFTLSNARWPHDATRSFVETFVSHISLSPS
eukprot:gene14597-14720_t